MIVLENVCRQYPGAKAVDRVDLRVPAGSAYGIIGKSGAGKSTLLRLMSLLERPDSGRVLYGSDRVDALEGADLIARRRRIGMIFQSFNLFSSRDVRGNVAYPLEIIGTPRRRAKERVEELLDLVGIADKAGARMSELSGGQKQRVAIARALAAQPDVLFCDEATSALDPQTTRSILELLKALKGKLNLTVVMVTHQMEVVRDACDRVAVLDEGRIAEEGPVRDVFSAPKAGITREFIGGLKPLEDAELEGELAREAAADSLEGVESGTECLRLHFAGGVTDEPILSRLARNLPVEFSILSGTIHRVDGERLGELVIELSGAAEARAEARARLAEQGIGVEDFIDA